MLNYIPPQRAANIARDAGLITANNRWCEVNWTTMESIKVPNVHVLGDATLSAPAMPKSGHMANQHGKAAAAAIVELLNGRTVVPPTMANTCYSFIDDRNAVHVASVHRWVPEKKTLGAVAGPVASRRRIGRAGRSKARTRKAGRRRSGRTCSRQRVARPVRPHDASVDVCAVRAIIASVLPKPPAPRFGWRNLQQC